MKRKVVSLAFLWRSVVEKHRNTKIRIKSVDVRSGQFYDAAHCSQHVAHSRGPLTILLSFRSLIWHRKKMTIGLGIRKLNNLNLVVLRDGNSSKRTLLQRPF